MNGLILAAAIVAANLVYFSCAGIVGREIFWRHRAYRIDGIARSGEGLYGRSPVSEWESYGRDVTCLLAFFGGLLWPLAGMIILGLSIQRRLPGLSKPYLSHHERDLQAREDAERLDAIERELGLGKYAADYMAAKIARAAGGAR